MTQWICIDDSVKEIKDEPWSMYWREQKSTSPEFSAFLKEPLKILIKELPGVKDDWRVSTEIINHDVGLAGNAVCKVALVFSLEKLVKIVMYKHPPGE